MFYLIILLRRKSRYTRCLYNLFKKLTGNGRLRNMLLIFDKYRTREKYLLDLTRNKNNYKVSSAGKRTSFKRQYFPIRF